MRETNGSQKYHPDDLKGKGEPSYSIEKALKEHSSKSHRRAVSDTNGSSAYELQTSVNTHLSPSYQSRQQVQRQRSSSNTLDGYEQRPSTSGRPSGAALSYADYETGMRRSHSTGKNVGEGLMRRFGSLRLGKGKGRAEM